MRRYPIRVKIEIPLNDDPLANAQKYKLYSASDEEGTAARYYAANRRKLSERIPPSNQRRKLVLDAIRRRRTSPPARNRPRMEVAFNIATNIGNNKTDLACL